MVSLGNVDEALQTAEANNVSLKEELAKKIIPAATDPKRKDICMRVAKLCKR